MTKNLFVFFVIVFASAGRTNAFSGTGGPRNNILALEGLTDRSRLGQPYSILTRSPSTSLNLFRTIAGGRHYQLEELEDSETSTTDVLLNTDFSVTLGRTDGPLFKEAWGTWSETFEDKRNVGGLGRRLFSMTITRKYMTGSESSDFTDIGEFTYEVERCYTGEASLVGGSVLAMSGDILDIDEDFGDRKVGFFNMIDTSTARKDDAVEP